MTKPTIGHNNPPPSPFELSESAINGLYDEAKNWLDGESITTQAQADEVSKLINLLRTEKKLADERRKEEAAPFDDGKAEVQERYAALIADTKKDTGKAVRAIDVAKRALTPFLEQQQREQEEVARLARAEADRLAEEARQAMQETQVDDLEAREEAEAKVKNAARAEASAKREEKARPAAKAAGVGRAVTLRTSWETEMVDPQTAARHYWTAKSDEMRAFILSLAQKDVTAGKRDIPGFTITEVKNAV